MVSIQLSDVFECEVGSSQQRAMTSTRHEAADKVAVSRLGVPPTAWRSRFWTRCLIELILEQQNGKRSRTRDSEPRLFTRFRFCATFGDCTDQLGYVKFCMSRSQKLVNKALAILQRHLPPDGLNDQKALAELKNLFDGSEHDDGHGTASERVKLAKAMLQRHKENALNDHQAMKEMYSILD
jgi:hypothetical protein